MKILNDFQLYILAYIEDNNLTRKAAADKFGVDPMTVSQWEKGQCNPRYDGIISLCRALNIKVTELFPEDIC